MDNELEFFLSALFFFIWFTAASEALLQMSGGRLHKLESAGKRELADKIEKWLKNKTSHLTVLRILIFLCVGVMASSAFPLIKDGFKSNVIMIPLITAVLTVFLIIIVEISAKLALFRTDIALLRFTMPLVKALEVSLFLPALTVLNLIQKRLDLWTDSIGDKLETSVEDEIMSFLENEENGEEPDERGNNIEEDERKMIKGVFGLDDTQVKEIMTPRVDVKGISIYADIEEAEKIFIETGHSRIPVFEESIDDIHGILMAKDFLDREKIKNKTILQLIHKPVFIPETKVVDDLLDELKINRNHFAVVIDEYGGTAGIITLEDIVEEIVGEIRDEYDQEDDSFDEPVKLSDDSYIVDARTLICNINDFLDTDLPEREEVDTIGGYICERLGKIPPEGEELSVDDQLTFRVMKSDKRKIITVKITKNSED